MGKVAFFPIYLIQKSPTWTHILRSPPFYYNHGEVCFFFLHKYTWNNVNITYAKNKKKTEPIFQTATSSGLLNCDYSDILVDLKLQVVTADCKINKLNVIMAYVNN